MLFNSLQFMLFFPAVVIIYYLLPYRWRYLHLLFASYFFYMSWEPGYAILIFITTVIVYTTGIAMHGKSKAVKRRLVALSIVSNLGILFTFKYFNFFSSNFNNLFSFMDLNLTFPYLKFLLPVGISFYTLQALSYTIDLYRGDREPERHFGIFALYVSFFPQLVAGPIERSTRLMPQFHEKFDFDYNRVVDGLKIMAWGFFKKLVVADRLAQYVDIVYNNPQAHEGGVLVIATYFFIFQVYCDFSAYSDIAIGAAQVMGYRLMDNFKRPYHSKSIAELWQRWHISLTSWFRDYVYIPLGGNRVSELRWNINILIVFVLSGLWHGAEWTFVVWASLNGIFTIIGFYTAKNRKALKDRLFNILITGNTVLVAGVGLAAVLFGVVTNEIGLSADVGINIKKIFFLLIGSFIIFSTIGKFVNRDFISASIENVKKLISILITFHLFTIAGVFFRAKSIQDGWYIITHSFSRNWDNLRLAFSKTDFFYMFLSIIIMEGFHVIQSHGSIRQMLRNKPLIIRWIFYYLLIQSIILYGVFEEKQFIYFQF